MHLLNMLYIVVQSYLHCLNLAIWPVKNWMLVCWQQ